MAIGTGSVGIEDDGSLTPGSNGYALAYYLSEKEAVDEYTVENGGVVLPDSERVKELRWYAKVAMKKAILQAPHLV